jgi:hypothetical protein
MTQPTGQSLYSVASGTSSTAPFIEIFEPRNPSSSDINYSVQQRWLNTSNYSEWILSSFTTVNQVLQAVWVQIQGSQSSLISLTGNIGGAVSPTAGNINIVGDGTTIDIVGNPGTSTLTVSSTGANNITFVADTGTATPVANTVNLLGGTGISTSATGNTVTTSLNIPVTVPDGGTGLTSSPTNGELLIGNGTGYTLNNLTSTGSTITITNGPGTINLETSGGGSVSGFRINTQVFTLSGTYIPTVGMKYCTIEVVGGGGGGGGTNATGPSGISSASGGGGGGYARGSYSSSTIGASQPITIGAGGAGGFGGSTNFGGFGGITSVGSLISATGGGGGQGTQTNANDKTEGGPGGIGIGGDFQTHGMPGGSSFYQASGSGITGFNFALGGFGGCSFFGGGALGKKDQSTGSYNALSYGGGGSGSVADHGSSPSQLGGSGYSGIVVITEYIF